LVPVTDIYHHYREMLAGRDVPIHEDVPYAGRYAIKRNNVRLPVAIGPDASGELVAVVDGKQVDPLSIWVSCAKHPVTQEAYKFRKQNGYWPDEPPPVARSNMPADPFEALKLTIDQRQAMAAELLDKHPLIKSQEVCNLFRNLQAEILSDIKEADGMHEVEKRPHLEAGRTIDEKFRFRATAKVLADRLRSRFETYLKEEERRQQAEAARKHREEMERVEAERKRLQAERDKLMRDDPIAALTSDAPELPELPLAPEQVKVQAGGGFGRKAGLRTDWVGEIEDYAKVLGHFSDHPDVRALIEKLVKSTVKTSKGTAKIPGVKIIEDRRAA
jgi:hypothetical protein